MAIAGADAPVAPDFAKIEAELDAGAADAGALRRAIALTTAKERLDKAVQEARRAATAEPRSVVARLALAHALRFAGDRAAAIAEYRACLDLDPHALSARYYLSALGDAPLPAQAPRELVVGLFDVYAQRFEADLVQDLMYRGPELLVDAVRSVLGAGARRLDILDAGCGTGLCGAAFLPLARRLDGVDLSPGMIAEARKKAIYDELVVGEATAALASASRRYDLVVAGDVLVYIGDLAPLFAAVHDVLRSSGVFAFTVERGAGAGYEMAPTGHYRHAAPYVAAEAARAGFVERAKRDCVTRLHRGDPVEAAVYVLGRR
jgi:predicted TPR repeat methyltransferase